LRIKAPSEPFYRYPNPLNSNDIIRDSDVLGSGCWKFRIRHVESIIAICQQRFDHDAASSCREIEHHEFSDLLAIGESESKFEQSGGFALIEQYWGKHNQQIPIIP